MTQILIPFSGLELIQVEPGTVIKDDKTGAQYTVTDDMSVYHGTKMYMTQKVYEQLKAVIQEKDYGKDENGKPILN